MALNKSDYHKDIDNYIEWVVYICALIYVVPATSTKGDLQIAAGVIAIFLGWINYSFFLKRFSLFGIYIIMAKRVFITVCKVSRLLSFSGINLLHNVYSYTIISISLWNNCARKFIIS